MSDEIKPTPANKPWHKNWKFLVPIGILTGMIGAGLTGGNSSTSSDSSTSQSSSSSSTTSANLDGLVGKYLSDSSFCVQAQQAQRISCAVSYNITNPTQSPVDITYTEIYAVVDGKIYKADANQGTDYVDTISQNWNPGDVVHGTSVFIVPEGAIISKVFFSDSSSLDAATTIFTVNLKAVSS
jgi:hypothetical protein